MLIEGKEELREGFPTLVKTVYSKGCYTEGRILVCMFCHEVIVGRVKAI